MNFTGAALKVTKRFVIKTIDIYMGLFTGNLKVVCKYQWFY